MEIEEGQESPSQEEAEEAPGFPLGPEPTEAERLLATMEEAERERNQFKNLLQRVQADFANYRRRMEEEQGEVQRSANAQLILKLLPVLDDLERALNHGEAAPTIESGWTEGVRLIARKFQATLEEVGIQRIEALDKPFDPWEHEIVSYQESSEHPEGQVMALIREGYKLNGKVLRPAQVLVVKALQDPTERSEPKEET